MITNKNYQNTSLADDDFERIYMLKSAADEVQNYFYQLSINYKAADSEEHIAMRDQLLAIVEASLQIPPQKRALAAYFCANVLYTIYEDLKTEGIEKTSWLNLDVISGFFVRETVFDLLRNEETQFIGLCMGVFVPDKDQDPAILAAVLQGATGDIVGADAEYNLLDNIEEIFDLDELSPIEVGKAIVGYINEANNALNALTPDDIL